ncbi:TPA: O30 family O-antigen polymerase, partial [Escherichia coli]|nr:O30 family O-antigen polymerase [Escherichia coli]
FSINILESLFIRRLLFIPALLNTYYFDFFDNKFVYYSSSYLSSIIDYPYDRPIPEVIGLNYFNSDEMSANNGYISDGFANAGSIGIFINIVLASILLKIFKDYDVNPKYAGLIFVSFYAIQGSAMSTVLMTHGGILLLILVPMVLGRRK